MPNPVHSALSKAGIRAPKKTTDSVWKGPEVDGITQSLLGDYLCDKERFRLLVIEGLKAPEGFSHRMEYGNMWHACEEAYATHGWTEGYEYPWEQPLYDYVKMLMAKHRMDQEQINKWYNVCLRQFPVYVRYWAEHADVTDRIPLLAEYAFSFPYRLPSGRIVRVRGKWDSVDVVNDNREVWLQENKVKGEVDEPALRRQLKFDLQTMLYLTMLYEARYEPVLNERIPKGARIAGVRYNVIRRPLSGGKGTIVQHKPSKSNPDGETFEHYMDRLGGIIADNASDFFMRWTAEVGHSHVETFRHTFLNPVLENVCDDYQWWDWCKKNNHDPFAGEDRAKFFRHTPRHFRYPFGVYNAMNEGVPTEYDNYLETGSEVGLERIDNLFPEL